MLGKGSFGTVLNLVREWLIHLSVELCDQVFEGLDVHTGELMAVKELTLPASPSAQEVSCDCGCPSICSNLMEHDPHQVDAIKRVEREVEVMANLRHPNIGVCFSEC